LKLLLLSASDLRLALPMRVAIETAKEAFSVLGTSSCPPRGVIASEGGTTLVMGAALPGALATKVVSVFPDNAERGLPAVLGLVVVLDPKTGLPVALCDGTFLTAWRTGAASGAATDLLARTDARIGAVIGCGAQARTQVEGIAAVRELHTIRIYGPRPDRVASFIREVAPLVEPTLEAAPTAEAAIEGAHIVCTATTSSTPVFDGRHLSAGAHINGVGSFRASMQEIGEVAVGRSRVFVDSVASALEEAGDLLAALERGATRTSEWTELGAVIRGEAPGRSGDEEITFFKSVGHAAQDVTAASRAVERARRLGLGREVDL
jgi:ornithine cyclodeaminase